ncbi:MAG: ThiF family adenylyltransferase [Planctomycetes bacterium]|nr:ThiF family adenylyltransferase [Planctomycetota bacterium]
MSASPFVYETAFGRNLGLITESEQAKLAALRVGLPGLGGVGGAHLQALARLGVGAFSLADPDAFEVANFNRQLGASLQTLGRGKADVAVETAQGINPEADVRVFRECVTAANAAEFLDGVDVVVDGIEFFHMDDRRALYAACRARGIPVVNAGPVGYGAAVLVFTPDGPSFDRYFGLSDEMTKAEKLIAFGLGLAPGFGGGVDPRYVDLERSRGPALAPSCMLCAAAAGMEVLKLVTGRGRLASPGRGYYLDPLHGRTLPLRARPALRGTLRGRFLRWAAFRHFPAFRDLHERELAGRARASSAAVRENAACARP